MTAPVTAAHRVQLAPVRARGVAVELGRQAALASEPEERRHEAAEDEDWCELLHLIFGQGVILLQGFNTLA